MAPPRLTSESMKSVYGAWPIELDLSIFGKHYICKVLITGSFVIAHSYRVVKLRSI